MAGSLILNDGNGGQTATIQLGNITSNSVLTLPSTLGATDTFCFLTLANCSGSATTLQAAYTADADGSDAEILLTATDGAIRIRDAASTVGDLLIVEANGGADYLTVTNTMTTVGGDLTVTGGEVYITPVASSASTTEGTVYYDSDTDGLLVYSNGKWQADRTDAVLVAASNSSQADKDAADYVADGNGGGAGDGDQIQINSALSAATGKKVILLAGTYVADETILVPNNTTLAGIGMGTIVQLDYGSTSDNLIEATGASRTGQIIRDMTLDGSLGTGGSQVGISFSSVGAGIGGSARQGGRVENVRIAEFNGAAIALDASLNNVITGVVADQNTGTGFYIGTASNNNTITNNKVQGSGNDGIYIVDSEYNIISNNTIEGGVTDGIEINNSYNNIISGNSIRNNVNNGMNLTLNGGWNTVTGNFLELNYRNISVAAASDNNTISGNTLSTSSEVGLYIGTNYNNITGNNIYDSYGASLNHGIYVDAGDYNSIVGNTISDTACDTTCYAINIVAGSDQNYLEGNRYGDTDADSGDDATTNDAGTGTIYAGQSTGTTTGTSVSNFLFRGTNSTTAFAVQNASAASILNVDTTNGEVEVGSTTTAGRLVISDGSSNTGTILLDATAGDYTFTIPTVTANDTFCLLTIGNCNGGGGLQATYNADANGSDTRIDLTVDDDSLIFSNPSNLGTDSTFVLKVEQLNTGAGVDALLVTNSGTGNILTLQDSGTTVLGVVDGGSLVGNNSASGVTGTTTGTGTNTTTLTLTADPFSVNDVIYIDNAGQDYVTRITVDPGTNSYTVSPAVTFETGRTVTRYVSVQNIGATSTDYTTLTNRFFQGYFLGGIVTGAGSTTYADGLISSSPGLSINTTSATASALTVNNSTSTGNVVSFQDNGTTVASIADGGAAIFRNGSDSTSAFRVQNAAATNTVFNVDTTNNRVGIGTATPSSTLEVSQADTSNTTLTISYNSTPLSSVAAYSSINFSAKDTSGSSWTTSYDTPESMIFSLVSDDANGVVYAGTEPSGIIYRCVQSSGCDASGDWAVSYDTASLEIRDMIIDEVNGVLYAGAFGSIIYRCVLSTACDASGDFTTVLDTSETYIMDLEIDTVNNVLYAVSGDNALVYRCVLSTACDASGDFTTPYDHTGTRFNEIVFDSYNGVLYAGAFPTNICSM